MQHKDEDEDAGRDVFAAIERVVMSKRVQIKRGVGEDGEGGGGWGGMKEREVG